MTDWVERLPGPSWLYYLGLLVVQLVCLTVLLWMNGIIPVGSIDLRHVFLIAIPPYVLWVRSRLDRVARAALDTFRPALAVSDAEFATLRYELTTLPARSTRVVTALAVLFLFVALWLIPGTILEQSATARTVLFIQFGPFLLLTLVTICVSTYHAIHQLQMVTNIHGLAKQINLFQSTPLYAFSGLTARTGVSFLLLVYYIGAVRPDLAFGGRVVTVLLVFIIPIAVGLFCLPLHGMHRQIAAEKKRLLAEANRRLEGVIAQVHQRIDDGMLADADKLNMQLTSLSSERGALANMPTWPWETETLAGFVSAVVLPVILWLVKYVVERFGF